MKVDDITQSILQKLSDLLEHSQKNAQNDNYAFSLTQRFNKIDNQLDTLKQANDPFTYKMILLKSEKFQKRYDHLKMLSFWVKHLLLAENELQVDHFFRNYLQAEKSYLIKSLNSFCSASLNPLEPDIILKAIDHDDIKPHENHMVELQWLYRINNELHLMKETFEDC